jgi:predicted peroxiredoxin
MAQRIVIHLSHAADDLTSAAMAIRIGTNLLSKEAQVTLLLDREGARLADTRQPLDLTTRRGKVLGEMYDGFVRAGGALLVCPHCAGAIGLTRETLRAGAAIAADDDAIAQLILDADKILDY